MGRTTASANVRPGTGASSSAAFDVLGSELVSGFPAEVSEGGPNGPVLASLQLSYGAPLVRSFACSGGVFSGKALAEQPGPIVRRLAPCLVLR